MPPGAYITQYYPPHNRATGIGWALGIGRFGAMAEPLIGGVFVQSDVMLAWNFFVFSAAVLPAALAVLIVPGKRA